METKTVLETFDDQQAMFDREKEFGSMWITNDVRNAKIKILCLFMTVGEKEDQGQYER